MSQRGGSVVTYVRFGDKVYSPVIAKGEADFIVSFEKIEAARYANVPTVSITRHFADLPTDCGLKRL